MEKRKKSFYKKRNALNIQENETEDALSQNLDTFRESCEVLVPKLKNIYIDRKCPDSHLGELMDDNLLESTTEVSSGAESDDYAEGRSDEDADTLDCSAMRKSRHFKKTMLEYFRSALPNPTETLKSIKFINRKDESAKTPKSKAKSETLANLGTQSKSLPEDENLSLCSTPCDSLTQHSPVNSYQSSNVRSAEEVLEHFKWYMKSNIKSLDRIKTDDISKVDVELFIKSGIRNFENPVKTPPKSSDNQKSEYPNTATVSDCQNLECATKYSSRESKLFTKFDIRPLSEYGVRIFENPAKAATKSLDQELEYPMDTATVSECQDLECSAKTVSKYSGQDSNHVTKFDIKPLSESGIRIFENPAKTFTKSLDQELEYPMDTATVSECLDLECSAKTVSKYSSQDSNHVTKFDIKPLSESGIRRFENPAKKAAKSLNQELEYPMDTETVSECQNLECSTKTVPKYSSQESKLVTKPVMIFAMKNDAGKVVSEASSARVEKPNTVCVNEKSIPRERIINDEKDEYVRWWILQQIKDREALLKFSILEGKYSKDEETKLKCIEEAEELQEETDELFDELDEYQKMTRNSVKRRVCFLKSPQKKKKRLEEGKINTFSSLFFHMYRYANESENIFKGLILGKFITAYEEYARSQKKSESESKTLEYDAKWQVVKLHFSLAQCRSKVKCKIAHPENKTLEEYQNFVNDLKMAANENLQCLNSILPRVKDVIFPLMSYLSHSRQKYKRVTSFLEEERPDVFSKGLDKNKAFFENFCSQYFKKN